MPDGFPAGFDVVLIAQPARRREAEEAIALAGGRLATTLDWRQAVAIADHAGPLAVLAIETEGAEPDLLAAALPGIAATIAQGGLNAVVTLDADRIDLVAGALVALPGAELLCAPSQGQVVVALAVAGRLAVAPGLSDRFREDEADRHRAIQTEAARLARIIVDFADRERGAAGEGDGVGDRHIAFGFQAPAIATDPQAIRQAIRARRLRDSFFGEALFEDPAWDMLLDLYAADLEGRRVSVSSLCIAAAVAPTTALRWMGRLTEAGLLERHPDPSDRRRAFMRLSPRALAGMEAYAAALRRAGLPFA